jgi:hypothetical protein
MADSLVLLQGGLPEHLEEPVEAPVSLENDVPDLSHLLHSDQIYLADL